MTPRSIDDWLRWQESLSPREIDLGLERVREVFRRLALERVAGPVFTIAGTNGKGSTAGFVDNLLRANGVATGLYTSPHLVRYNERVQVNGDPVTDIELVRAFEAIEAVRGDLPLTYFEFGTLAAMTLLSGRQLGAWILEIGLGGRLDAVNAIDPDFSLITTVALDHQDWLGQTIDEIAAEKAGIMRPATPAFFGDEPVPAAIEARARESGAKLRVAGRDFGFSRQGESWSWRGAGCAVAGLPQTEPGDDAELRNISLALAAVEAHDPALLEPQVIGVALRSGRPSGRFQIVRREHQWILDVAHNPQAAAVLRNRIGTLGPTGETTAVLSMLGRKRADAFARELLDSVDRWVVCATEDADAISGPELAATIEGVGGEIGGICQTPEDAFEYAARITGHGGRILVCGSFRIVGPALVWLGLY